MGIFGRAAASFLPDRDYLPLAMPTTDLALLDVLTRDGSVLRRYTALPHVLRPLDGEPTYVCHLGAPVADASGASARSAKAGIGLGVVAGIVQALGADAHVDLSVSRGHTVEYSYVDVTADRVDVATLDTWLARCDLDPRQRNAAQLLVAERLYVVVAVLKANGLRVSVLDEQSHEVALDVPALQQVVGAKVSVSGSSSRAGTVTFQGATALAVAAKAAQLSVDDNGLWVAERPMGDGEIRDLSRGAPTFLSGTELAVLG